MLVAFGVSLSPLFDRTSNSQPDVGMWQSVQAIFPVSPAAPRPPFDDPSGFFASAAPSAIGPASRLSKKILCPSSAAFGSSAYLLVGSGGGFSGSGESV